MGRVIIGMMMSIMPTNEAEQFVSGLCRQSVLSLWCYNNPRGKVAGNELCDVLVVCAPHIDVVSVKEVLLKVSDNPAVEMQRRERKGVYASIKQIHGAERWLTSASHVIREGGSCAGSSARSSASTTTRTSGRILGRGRR